MRAARPGVNSFLGDFNMSKLRIAVAGAGVIGLRHIEEIQKSQSARLSAVVDPSPKAAEVAKKVGVPIYKTPEGVIAKGRPDGVVLATPNQRRVEQSLQCIAAGIPVLVEKPIAHSRGRQAPGSNGGDPRRRQATGERSRRFAESPRHRCNRGGGQDRKGRRGRHSLMEST